MSSVRETLQMSPAEVEVLRAVLETIEIRDWRYAPDLAAAVAERLTNDYEVRAALRNVPWPHE